MKNILFSELGDLYFKANAFEDAIDSYQKAIQQGFHSGELYANLAAAYMRQGHIVESIELYKQSLDLLTNNHDKAITFTKIGECYRQLQEFDRAIEAFRNAIELEPGNPKLCEGLGQIQKDLEKLYSVEDIGETPLIKLESDESPKESSQGLKEETKENSVEKSHMETNDEIDKTRSTTVMEDCAEIMPPVFTKDNLSKLSELIPEDGSVDSSKKVPPFLEETPSPELETSANGNNSIDNSSIENHPSSNPSLELIEDKSDRQTVSGNENLDKKDEGVRVTMFLTLGIIYWRNGSLQDAELMLRSAIKSAKKINNTWMEALAWHGMALVKTDLAEIQGAIEAHLKSAELAPDQIFPWNNIGTLYNRLDESEKAMKSLRFAIRKNPEDGESWDELGDIYTKLGNLEDAIAAYQLGNIFGLKALGQFAARTYEKALDFYHFTINSEDEDKPEKTLVEGEQDEILGKEKPSSQQIEPQANVSNEAQPPVEDEVAGKRHQISQEVASLEGISNQEEENSVQVVTLYEQFMDGKVFSDHTSTPVEQVRADAVWIDTAPEKISVNTPMQVIREDQPDLEMTSTHLRNKSLEDGLTGNNFVKKEPDPRTHPTVRLDEISTKNAEGSIVDLHLAESNDPPEVEEENPDEGMLPMIPTDQLPHTDINHVGVSIASYEATVRENPYNDRAWDSLGNLYRIVQRNKDAIRAFEQAVSLEPNKYVYHYELGTLYASAGNFEDAIREVQTVVELNPDFTFAHCALASYLRRVGQDEAAQKHIALAAPFIKSEKEYDRACFESIRGNVDGAVELLKIALQKKQTTIEWIQRDLDLDFIRQDPRYRLLTSKSPQSVVGYL